MGGRQSKRKQSPQDALLERSETSVRQMQAELAMKTEQLAKLQELLSKIEAKQEGVSARVKARKGDHEMEVRSCRQARTKPRATCGEALSPPGARPVLAS